MLLPVVLEVVVVLSVITEEVSMLDAVVGAIDLAVGRSVALPVLLLAPVWSLRVTSVVATGSEARAPHHLVLVGCLSVAWAALTFALAANRRKTASSTKDLILAADHHRPIDVRRDGRSSVPFR